MNEKVHEDMKLAEVKILRSESIIIFVERYFNSYPYHHYSDVVANLKPMNNFAFIILSIGFSNCFGFIISADTDLLINLLFSILNVFFDIYK